MTSTDDTDDDVGQSPKAIIINLPFSLCVILSHPDLGRRHPAGPSIPRPYNIIHIYIYTQKAMTLCMYIYLYLKIYVIYIHCTQNAINRRLLQQCNPAVIIIVQRFLDFFHPLRSVAPHLQRASDKRFLICSRNCCAVETFTNESV